MSDLHSNAAQRQSPSYRLAALDPDFILGDSTRAIRMALEYQKVEDALRAARIESTIVVFGSARCAEDSPGDLGRWYAEARKFGALASRRGGARDSRGAHLNVICTGGGPGLMEAANRGAHDAGAPSIGFNITLPHEEAPNPYTTPELTFRFHYFALRKMHFAMRAAALVVFPGGFGTMDELFELLTLRQTKKKSALPIVLACAGFWRRAVNFEAFVEAGTISPEDLDLFTFAEDAEEAWAAMGLGKQGIGEVSCNTVGLPP